MRKGLRLEAMVRDVFGRKIGFNMLPACFERIADPWMRASLDGYEVVESVPHTLEIKIPGLGDHTAILCGVVPEHFAVQIQWQLFVAKAEVCHLVSWSDSLGLQPKDQMAHVIVKADRPRQHQIAAAAREFWKRVINYREKAKASAKEA